MTPIHTSAIIQDNGVKTAKVGENVYLECTCQENSVTFIFWYQQTLGGKPQLISSRMKHQTESDMNPEFKDRFKVFANSEDGINNLHIIDVRLSDSATYYCGILEFNAIEFGQGVFLHVNTTLSNIQAVVYQSQLEPLQSGDSVNFSCTVYTEQNARVQSFYWLRHDASQPAIMYPRSGQCTNISEEVKTRCDLYFHIKTVDISTTGIYYCAVASYGEIVFGNGTEIEIMGMWW